MRSKAWLAASVWLRLARLPPPASRARRSRRLSNTLAAAPGLLAHASVTEVVKFCPMGPKLRHTDVHACEQLKHKHAYVEVAVIAKSGAVPSSDVAVVMSRPQPPSIRSPLRGGEENNLSIQ